MNKWLVLFVTLLLSACGGGSGSGSGDAANSSLQGSSESGAGDARIGLIFTDATTPEYTHALVTFTKVELVGEDRRVNLFSGEQTLDLLRLPDFYEFVDTASVPAGEYKSVWITATNVSLVSEDIHGNEIITEAKLPSGIIKVLSKSSFSVNAGDVLFLEIDFDMNKALKLTTTGSGKVILRPVVFANIYSQMPLNKFIRVHGTLENLNGQTFDLCQTHMITNTSEALPADTGRCFDVIADADTGLFADLGLPIDLGQLQEGDAVTVIGRMNRQRNFVPDVPDEALPSEGFCRIWYLELEPGDQPEALPCEAVGIVPENAVLVDSDGVTSEHLFQIMAYTVEKGPLGAFSRFSGEIDAAIDELLAQFDFDLASAQGLDTSAPLPVQLFDKSRIFNADGVELSRDDIQPGLSALVDAVFVPSNFEPDVLRSPFVLLSSVSPELETLSGNVTAVDIGSEMVEVQLESLATVMVDASDANIYLITSTVDSFSSEEIDVTEIPVGNAIEVLGEEDESSGNFIADTIFIQAE